MGLEGGMVGQWLVLLPQSKNVLGLIPTWGRTLFACSPHVLVGFL